MKRVLLRVGLVAVCVEMSACMASKSGGASGTASASTPVAMARYRPSDSGRSPWQWRADAGGGRAVGVDGVTQRVAVAAVTGEPGVAGDTNLSGTGVMPGARGGGAAKSLRRGDKVIIYLRGIPESEDITDAVDDVGSIKLPLIGSVGVEGKTTSEVERLVERLYIDGGYYTKINVIIVSQEQEFFVRGEVKREGRYPLSGEVTLMQAIATAGGYTDFARPTAVRLIRGEEVAEFDASRIERRKDPDPIIKAGDMIVVPRRFFLP